MLVKGLALGLVITAVIFGFAFFLRSLGVSEVDSNNSAIVTYMILTVALGYFLKKAQAKEKHLGEITSKRLFWLATGAVVPMVTLAIAFHLGDIKSVGTLWPLFLIALIPFAIFSQAIHFWVLVLFGVWLCKKSP